MSIIMLLHRIKCCFISLLFLFSFATVYSFEEETEAHLQKYFNTKKTKTPKKVAICYWGLTRSTKQVYVSHYQKFTKLLSKANLKYDIFMHTWKIKGKQRIWHYEIDNPVDYEEYKLLNPDYYQIDEQDAFTENLEFDKYFIRGIDDNPATASKGDWPAELSEKLIFNHLCALESLKRVTEMVENTGNKYDVVIYIRPDVLLKNRFPVNKILNLHDFDILIPDFDHWAGYNDRFAAMNFNTALIYGKRIDGLAEFRGTQAKITSERYVKHICDIHNLNVILVPFYFDIIRP